MSTLSVSLNKTNDLKALVFDLIYERHSGVIVYIRVFQGELITGQKIKFLNPIDKPSFTIYKIEQLGVNSPDKKIKEKLNVGEIGWFTANIRWSQKDVFVGSTIVSSNNVSEKPMFLEYLQKFLNTKSNLFCNIFPDENTKLSCLEGAIKELSLQDNGLSVELVSSQLLGRGFHCGFIGMFQKDIFCLRLQKEFECHIISTPPSVYFQITYTDNKVQIINNPNLVNDKKIKEIAELMLEVTIFIPEKYLGPIKNLCQNYRGILQLQEFKDEISLFNLVYKMPFIEFIDEFNEKLKFLSQGYACLDYKFIGFQTNKIVKVDILLNNQLIPDLSFFSHWDQVYIKTRKICQKLKESLSRRLFSIAIQACVGKRVIVRENLTALKKQVTGNLYGGDRTRKMKLWKKQKSGKLKSKETGQINFTIKEFKKLFREKNE